MHQFLTDNAKKMIQYHETQLSYWNNYLNSLNNVDFNDDEIANDDVKTGTVEEENVAENTVVPPLPTLPEEIATPSLPEEVETPTLPEEVETLMFNFT